MTTPGAQRPNPAFLIGIGWEKGWNGRGFRIDGQGAPELCFVAFPRCSVQGLAAFGVIMHGYPLGFIGISFGIHRDVLWGFFKMLNISSLEFLLSQAGGEFIEDLRSVKSFSSPHLRKHGWHSRSWENGMCREFLRGWQSWGYFWGRKEGVLSWLLVQSLDFSQFFPGGNKSGISLKALSRCGERLTWNLGVCADLQPWRRLAVHCCCHYFGRHQAEEIPELFPAVFPRSRSRAVVPALDFVAGLLKLSWRSGLGLGFEGFVCPRFGCGSVEALKC